MADIRNLYINITMQFKKIGALQKAGTSTALMCNNIRIRDGRINFNSYKYG